MTLDTDYRDSIRHNQQGVHRCSGGRSRDMEDSAHREGRTTAEFGLAWPWPAP